MHSFVTVTDSNMQFIIHSSRNTKQYLLCPFFLKSDSVGAPVGGIHSIINVAAANRLFLSISRKVHANRNEEIEILSSAVSTCADS